MVVHILVFNDQKADLFILNLPLRCSFNKWVQHQHLTNTNQLA